MLISRRGALTLGTIAAASTLVNVPTMRAQAATLPSLTSSRAPAAGIWKGLWVLASDRVTLT